MGGSRIYIGETWCQVESDMNVQICGWRCGFLAYSKLGHCVSVGPMGLAASVWPESASNVFTRDPIQILELTVAACGLE